MVLRAPRVVVAAGGLNTLKILLRSTVAGGLGAIPALGRHFSMGADTVAFYRLPRHIGPEAITGHLVDAQIQVPGSGNEFDQQILRHRPLVPGKLAAAQPSAAHRSPVRVRTGRDGRAGELEGSGIVVRHEPQALVARIQTSLDRMAQALGGEKPVRPLDPKRRACPWLSIIHGGCRMATDASRGWSTSGSGFRQSRSPCCRSIVPADHDDCRAATQCRRLGSWIAERIVNDTTAERTRPPFPLLPPRKSNETHTQKNPLCISSCWV